MFFLSHEAVVRQSIMWVVFAVIVWGFFCCHFWRWEETVASFIPTTEALESGIGTLPDVSVLALDSFSQHILYVRRLQRFRVRLCGETGAQLHCEPPHLVAVQVLLDQVALPRDPCLYVDGDVWNQPRHEELHHKHHMLPENKRYIMGINQFSALFSIVSKK